MKVSSEGLALIKALEGYRPSATPHPDGGWVVGYGHTASAREGVSVSERDAELLLRYDLLPVEEVIRRTVRAPLNARQFDSLASFGLSVGAEALLGSDVVRLLNAGDTLGAQAVMARTPPTRIALDPAMRRRGVERALFSADPSKAAAVADLLLAPPVDPFPLPPLSEDVETPLAGLESSTDLASDGDAAAAVAAFPTGGETEDVAAADEVQAHATGDDTSSAEPALTTPALDTPVALAATAGPILLDGAFGQRRGGAAATPEAIFTTPPAATSREQLVEAAAPLILVPSDEVVISTGRPVWSQDQRLAGPIEGDGLFGPDAGLLGGRQGVSTRSFDARAGKWSGTGPALAVGAIGLAAFGLSMAAFRLFVTRPEAANGSTVVGAWLLAALGLACVGVAAHRIYRGMGERPAAEA